MKELYLYNNKISDINVLKKVNFNELEDLNFSNNEISNIDVLIEVKFDKLKILNLNHNKIINTNFNGIDILEYFPILTSFNNNSNAGNDDSH